MGVKENTEEWLLTITQGQFDPIIYQLTKANEDSLMLHCLNWIAEKDFILKRIRKLGIREVRLNPF